ncbi:hypothetical protein [Leucobacter iarius]|uniref:DUF3311 domain-containing protein n=1 Tax=Leucobacter iarius TaxID=333963 RepID=A0ABN2L9R8_9MICO
MERPRLFTPGRAAIVAVPTLGFLATPFLPFVTEPTLVFGVPAAMVWAAGMVLLSAAALHLVEARYARSGGHEADAREAAGSERESERGAGEP